MAKHHQAFAVSCETEQRQHFLRLGERWRFDDP
jgi:hypothetical protein